ncbi:unnamed protein product [Amoebophrya sp. A25]|nr:unnamed protein product [Amoebophrya sp. A25]|eukprot:GSA25T00000965001.1
MDPIWYSKTREVVQYWAKDVESDSPLLFSRELFFFRQFIRSMHDRLKREVEGHSYEAGSGEPASDAKSPHLHRVGDCGNIARQGVAGTKHGGSSPSGLSRAVAQNAVQLKNPFLASVEGDEALNQTDVKDMAGDSPSSPSLSARNVGTRSKGTDVFEEKRQEQMEGETVGLQNRTGDRGVRYDAAGKKKRKWDKETVYVKHETTEPLDAEIASDGEDGERLLPEPLVDSELIAPGHVAAGAEQTGGEVDQEAPELTEYEADQVAAWSSLAAEAAEDGDYASAVADMTKVLKLVQPRATAMQFARRADYYLRLRRPVAAVQDCDRALELNPDSAKAFRVRGKANRKLQRWDAAHTDLETAQKLDFDEGVEETRKFVLAKWKKLQATRVQRRVEVEQRLEREREEKRKREAELVRRKAEEQKLIEDEKRRKLVEEMKKEAEIIKNREKVFESHLSNRSFGGVGPPVRPFQGNVYSIPPVTPAVGRAPGYVAPQPTGSRFSANHATSSRPGSKTTCQTAGSPTLGVGGRNVSAGSGSGDNLPGVGSVAFANLPPRPPEKDVYSMYSNLAGGITAGLSKVAAPEDTSGASTEPANMAGFFFDPAQMPNAEPTKFVPGFDAASAPGAAYDPFARPTVPSNRSGEDDYYSAVKTSQTSSKNSDVSSHRRRSRSRDRSKRKNPSLPGSDNFVSL